MIKTYQKVGYSYNQYIVRIGKYPVPAVFLMIIGYA